MMNAVFTASIEST